MFMDMKNGDFVIGLCVFYLYLLIGSNRGFECVDFYFFRGFDLLFCLGGDFDFGGCFLMIRKI